MPVEGGIHRIRSIRRFVAVFQWHEVPMEPVEKGVACGVGGRQDDGRRRSQPTLNVSLL